MRFVTSLVFGTACWAGCSLFGDRPCEPGRYACPESDLATPTDLSAARVCTLESPCTLPTPTSSTAEGVTNLIAITGRDGEAWIVGSGSGQGFLLHALPGQAVMPAATLPITTPRALTVSPTGPLTLFITSQGNALYQYVVSSAQLTTLPLATGSCQGRINPAGTVDAVRALSPSDLWLGGAPTIDAAAGLFRVRNGVCLVLPELASAGLAFSGVWGEVAPGPEPATRVVWTVGDSGAAVRWEFQGPDGAPVAQRLAIASGTPLRAVSGSAPCPTTSGNSDGQNAATCTFMISSSALYSARTQAPASVELPTAVRGAELTSVFADGSSVWLVGTLAAAGFIARYQPATAAWSYLSGLSGGAPRAAWGPGDGSLWVVGDQGTVRYVAKSP
jgi:hypothetical protein